ncbi:YbaK/EbsC family protein [Paracraurococcus ruber]|uniref:Prolyl-tRNA editing protein n=1 Tax=Paracraurococcus ruber TaxID=77675 RepID=A0ABS1D1D8_9PROT|nr:YbaK/EbsC family protein [Paracraurococcus ruber]MBK1660425.1 prolyl-tRNA editing protein [Paracraurococcus ruber]TDG29124.1 YbaK/EbsC family protein [Paracraurococcus ruber]
MGAPGSSVERVRAALLAAGHPDTIQAFPEGTRSAAEAAAAVGCAVAQIAKSIVFRAGLRPVLVVASGANRVDMGKAGAALGESLRRAEGGWVRDVTGFAIGGVAPLAHLTPPLVLLDRDLLGFDQVWAAAGSPMHVFATSPAELLRLSGGQVAEVAEG